MTHRTSVRLSKLSLALVAALVAAPAFAQSTSAGLGGTVSGADGQPVAGAEVTITHVESGTVSRALTDASGNYSARGLRVGGPYTITINKPGEGATTRSNIYLQLNQVADIDASLAGDVTDLGGVTVVASAAQDLFTSDTKGIGTSVSGRELEIMPQGNRSIDDVARLDPRITVIDQASGSISVAGINNRFNDISVDGMSVQYRSATGTTAQVTPLAGEVPASRQVNGVSFDVRRTRLCRAAEARYRRTGVGDAHTNPTKSNSGSAEGPGRSWHRADGYRQDGRIPAAFPREAASPGGPAHTRAVSDA